MARKLRAAQTILACVSIVIGLYVFLSTIRMMTDCWSSMPWQDEWYNIVTLHAIPLSWWFEQINEHRILVPRLIFLLDYWLASDTRAIDFAVSAIFQTGLVVSFIALSRGAQLVERVGTLWVAGLSMGLLFWSIQYGNFCLGLSGLTLFGVQLAAVLALIAICVGRATAATLTAAVVFEFVAVYSLASGLFVPLLAIPLAIWSRRPRSHIVVLSVAATILLALYLIGYQTPPASKPIALSSVLPALPYLLVQLGGPFSGDHEGLAAIIGLTGLVLFAAFGLRTLKAGNTTEKALAAICAFVLAQLAVTALGRVNVESAMTSRYTSAPLLFWLSIALWASAGTAKRPIRSASVMGLMVSVLAFVAITEGPFAKEATNWAAIRKLAIPPVLANVPDNDLLKQVYPNPGIPLKFRSDIVAAKTMMFAEEWTRWLGTRLSDHVSIEDSPDCGASFTNAFPVPGINGDAWRATGRTWRNERGSAPTRIILTDDDGRIVGYGVGGFAASSINEKPIPDSLWWFGDFKAEDPEKAIAYVFEPIRSTACKIGTHGKTPT